MTELRVPADGAPLADSSDVTPSGARPFFVVAFALATAAVEAQEGNSFAVGVSVSRRMSPDRAAQGEAGIGVKWRIGHSDTGWSWHYGLGWYAINLDRDIRGRTTRLGELTVRSFLGGYGYTRRLTPRLSVTGDVVGGFAFTAIALAPQADAALHTPPGDTVRVLTGTTAVLKPEVSLWYDVTKRFGISVDAGYFVARPRLIIDTPFAHESGHIRADAFTISTGLVCRIF